MTDRIVLIGVTAPSSKDVQATPFAQTIPGVFIQAQMVSQLISAVKDGRAPIGVWPWPAEIFWVWVWAFIGSVVAWRCRSILWLLGLEITALGTLCIICFYGLMQSQWVPLVPTALVFIITTGGVAVIVTNQDRNFPKAPL